MAEDTIIYRHDIDRPPTMQDRSNKVGFEGFLEVLREHGWVEGDDTVAKNFKVEYQGHDGGRMGNHFIEWKAILS